MDIIKSVAAAETKEEKEATAEAKPKPKRAEKAPAKPLPEMMEEDVIPSLKATLAAQQDISELELSFSENKVGEKVIPPCICKLLILLFALFFYSWKALL